MADESVQLKTLQTILIIFQSHLHPENEVIDYVFARCCQGTTLIFLCSVGSIFESFYPNCMVTQTTNISLQPDYWIPIRN